MCNIFFWNESKKKLTVWERAIVEEEMRETFSFCFCIIYDLAFYMPVKFLS